MRYHRFYWKDKDFNKIFSSFLIGDLVYNKKHMASNPPHAANYLYLNGLFNLLSLLALENWMMTSNF